MDKVKNRLHDTNRLLVFVVGKFNWLIPDKLYLKTIFRFRMGKRLNLQNPITYSEKLQWLKLYDHRPEYTTMVDKYAVKEYVANIIGRQFVIPTIGVWERAEDIDWEQLPKRFVLKCTHDSGGIVICKDKGVLDKQKALTKLNKSLNHNYYLDGREWPYKNVKPRIIAEVYMEDSQTEELRDYKFFCFDGIVKYLFIATDRQKLGEDVKFDFYDSDFNHLPFLQGHENAPTPPSKPAAFDVMKELAAKLSQNIPQVRVDFYEVDGKAFFGELTFFHHGGWTPFEPEEWDYKFGEEIKLPAKRFSH